MIHKLLYFVIAVIVVDAGASPLFDDDAVLQVELSGPLALLIASKKERIEHPFVLSANGVEHKVKVRVRGKSRTRTRVCDFPPLRINFIQEETKQTVFAGQDKLKLVTHCRKSDVAQIDALEEFAAYRIFNLISNISYKVRLLRVTYRDIDGQQEGNLLERYGFLIESGRGLADRTGGQPANVTGVTLHSLDDEQAAAMYVFQYLIGNTDWSLVMTEGDDTCCHNGDIFDIRSSLYYVPYDFDLAGLVNARYAYPDPSLRIRRVTQRLYRGFCTSRETLATALGAIKARRSIILGVLTNIPGLSDKDIESSANYLKRFFDIAKDEEKLLGSFERQCL